MRLFDTHCHLQDPRFEDVDGVIARATAVGVERMLLCGYDLPSSEVAVEMADRFPSVLAAVGIHPHDAHTLTPDVVQRLETLLDRELVVAVGEIGLDFYRDLSPRDVQHRTLELQLELAASTGKPVSVHSRGAEQEISAPLQAYVSRTPLSGHAPVGVMHCFGGTIEQARVYAEMGFLISIPCTVTYPNNETGRKLAADLPLDVLVLETDSPYLPPQSHRGRRNEPAFVNSAVETIATLRGLAVDEVAEATTRNAERVFGAGVRESAGAS